MADKFKMLNDLSSACQSCGMCELGWAKAKQGGSEHDPHVFGELDRMGNLPKIMIIGQNPGWNEVCEGRPFVGAAGKTFEKALDTYGGKYCITRNSFYITNAVKCFTKDNAMPTAEHISRCEPFLRMEIQTIKPKFIVTLGAVSFGLMCPDAAYQGALGKFTLSEKFGVKVFAVYHPSPRNLSDRSRLEKFNHDMKLLCELIGRLESPF